VHEFESVAGPEAVQKLNQACEDAIEKVFANTGVTAAAAVSVEEYVDKVLGWTAASAIPEQRAT
jgi:hypothetical protein